MKSPTGKKDMYYELAMVNKIRTDKKDILPISLKDAFDDTFRFTASMGTYRRVDPVGSYATAPISGMFGAIPKYKAYAQKALGYTEEERQRLLDGPVTPAVVEQQAKEWEANYGGAVNTGSSVTESDSIGNYPDAPWNMDMDRDELIEDYSQVDGSVIGFGVTEDAIDNSTEDMFSNMPVRDKLKYKYNMTFRMDSKSGKIVYKQGKEKYTFEGTPEQLLRSLENPAGPAPEITEASAPKPKRRLGGGFNLSNRSVEENISKSDLGKEVEDTKDKIDCKRKK
jgi:hypothetical protein